MGMSAYAKLETLLYMLTTDAVDTRPTSWEVSLHTADPGTDGTANEVTDANYVRQAVTFVADVTDPVTPFLENSAIITYPSADTGFVATHFVVWDNADNPHVIQQLRVAKTIAIGEAATFAAGDLTVGR